MTDAALKSRLATLIEDERTALLTGDFDKIAELMDEKQALAVDLDQVDLPSAEVAPLRDGLRRNQELFDQALAGLRNVASRLGELQRVRRSMDTYDQRGNKMTIDAPRDNKLERRA